jgi:hypothetical protein
MSEEVKPATDKQKSFMKFLKLEVPDGLSMKEASDLIKRKKEQSAEGNDSLRNISPSTKDTSFCHPLSSSVGEEMEFKIIVRRVK